MFRFIGLFIALALAGLSHAVEVKPEINGTMDAACRAAPGTCPTWVTASRYTGTVTINGDYVQIQDISILDSLYSAVFASGDNSIVQNLELGWMGDAGFRAAASVTTGQLVRNNTVHHFAYAEYADEVLSDPSFSGVPIGNPPAIYLHVNNNTSPTNTYGVAYGNRIYTGYREGIGCYRTAERSDSSFSCWVIGNIMSNVKNVGIYFANASGIAESNIVYEATDDDWGRTGSSYVAGKESAGVGFDDCDDCYFRNNLSVNVSAGCLSSILQEAAKDAGETNTLIGWNNTCIHPTGTSPLYDIANNGTLMINNEAKNNIFYGPSASEQCDLSTTTSYTLDTNFWDSTVNEAACSDAGDQVGAPSLVGSLSQTYTVASPPDPDDFEYSSGTANGVGDGTPLTTTVFSDTHFPHYDKLDWWDDQGYTKPSLAQLKKQADVDFKGKDRDDVNPDIGAFEF